MSCCTGPFSRKSLRSVSRQTSVAAWTSVYFRFFKLDDISQDMFALKLGLLFVLCTAVSSTSKTCTGVARGVYKMENRCTGRHISEALSAGEGCTPRPALMTLPWPNSTQIDQVTRQALNRIIVNKIRNRGVKFQYFVRYLNIICIANWRNKSDWKKIQENYFTFEIWNTLTDISNKLPFMSLWPK